MVKAVLFDLDGTLLPTPFESLIPDYLGMLGQYFKEHGDPRWIAGEVMKATEVMVAGSDGQRINLDTFADSFFAATGWDRALWRRFDQFYEDEFPKLGARTEQNPAARVVVEDAIRRGMKVVVATNPLFPDRAIAERLNWAGLSDVSFDLITTGENMHYCKPHPEYYQEIAQRIDVVPEQCLMVGDDLDQDGPAEQAGMQLFLLQNGAALADVSEYLAGKE